MDQPRTVFVVQCFEGRLDGSVRSRKWTCATWAAVEEVFAHQGRFNTISVEPAFAEEGFLPTPFVRLADTHFNALKAGWQGAMSGPCSADPVFGDRAGVQE